MRQFLSRKVGVKVSEERHAISEIPFPAVTFCPEPLINESDFDDFDYKQLTKR
jgi:Amiloride-sensitive sodium channel